MQMPRDMTTLRSTGKSLQTILQVSARVLQGFYSHRNRRMQMPCNVQLNRESVADLLSLSVTVYYG